jgi:hypothetical protein
MKKSSQKLRKDKRARSTITAAKVKRQKPARSQRSAKYKGKKLAPGKAKTLKILELKIRKGLAEFVNVGLSLRDIRDKKLYKASHRKFSEYCQSSWNFSPKQAYRLMAAAEIVEQLKAGKGRVSRNLLPKRESQVRPLARLCDCRCNPATVWKKAIKEAKGKAPSAALVSKLVNECLRKTGSGARRSRGSSGPNGKIAKIQKILEKVRSNTAGQSKRFYEQTLMKIRNLVGEPKA